MNTDYYVSKNNRDKIRAKNEPIKATEIARFFLQEFIKNLINRLQSENLSFGLSRKIFVKFLQITLTKRLKNVHI